MVSEESWASEFVARNLLKIRYTILKDRATDLVNTVERTLDGVKDGKLTPAAAHSSIEQSQKLLAAMLIILAKYD